MAETPKDARPPSPSPSPGPDPGTDSMFERTLALTPKQRLADAARIARFVLRGRERLAIARDG